jgi:hypothetical protein
MHYSLYQNGQLTDSARLAIDPTQLISPLLSLPAAKLFATVLFVFV